MSPKAQAALLALLLVAAPALPAQTPITTTLVANGFTQPVGVTAPPGDPSRLFVIQQGGLVRIIKNGSLLGTAFIDLSGPVLTGSERGLLGFAFHPNYLSNGYFYVNYTRDPDGATVVARYEVSANPDVADAGSGLTLLTIGQPASNHNGGAIQFGPDGYLYIALGDGGSQNDPSGNGQNINTRLGKILRIDVDNPAPPLPYGIPPSNPFAGAVPGLDDIWAIGLRNPWRISFDRLTGDMYIGDVGQNAREEIDFQSGADFFAPAGSFAVRNYGWRCMEGTLCTGFTGCTCNAPALTLPIHTYVNNPCYAVVGGHVYRGSAIPDLRGTYFFAEYCANQIWSFRYTPAGGLTDFTVRTAQLDPPGILSLASISSFGEDACGELHLVDRSGGEIFKVVPQTPQTTGLANFGSGTPGCSGPHALAATHPPVLLNPCFALTSTNAPPNASGILALGELADVAGSDPFGVGLTLHVSLASSFLLLLPIPSDAAGVGKRALPIPNLPSLVNGTLHAQAFWPWSPGVCVPSGFGLSSSEGLSITIQP